MKTNFRVGDLVRDEIFPELGVQEVIEYDLYKSLVKVRLKTGAAHWVPCADLKLAETPLQIMKRRYSEKE